MLLRYALMDSPNLFTRKIRASTSRITPQGYCQDNNMLL